VSAETDLTQPQPKRSSPRRRPIPASAGAAPCDRGVPRAQRGARNWLQTAPNTEQQRAACRRLLNRCRPRSCWRTGWCEFSAWFGSAVVSGSAGFSTITIARGDEARSSIDGSGSLLGHYGIQTHASSNYSTFRCFTCGNCGHVRVDVPQRHALNALLGGLPSDRSDSTLTLTYHQGH
jgi:hypothetical protein